MDFQQFLILQDLFYREYRHLFGFQNYFHNVQIVNLFYLSLIFDLFNFVISFQNNQNSFYFFFYNYNISTFFINLLKNTQNINLGIN